jgi:hypothetical protein
VVVRRRPPRAVRRRALFAQQEAAAARATLDGYLRYLCASAPPIGAATSSTSAPSRACEQWSGLHRRARVRRQGDALVRPHDAVKPRSATRLAHRAFRRASSLSGSRRPSHCDHRATRLDTTRQRAHAALLAGSGVFGGGTQEAIAACVLDDEPASGATAGALTETRRRRRCLGADPPTRDYIQRRRSEGKSTREAIRCRKRYLARRVWRLLQPPTPPRTSTRSIS